MAIEHNTSPVGQDFLTVYAEYDRLAKHWLDGVEEVDEINAVRWLRTAQVYATLAQAAATADLSSRGLEIYGTVGTP